MRVPQKSTSLARYNSIKSKLQQAAAKPSNEALFKQEGDRFELTQTVSFPLDGQKLVVKKGSAFDNDIQTRDMISVETTQDGTVQADTFEHYSEKRGLVFKRDQEMLQVTFSDRQGMNFSNSTMTFEV
jgi:hypothetical protein